MCKKMTEQVKIICGTPELTRRISAIDTEIADVKQMLDDTYNIDHQIGLSKCLVTLYTLKKEALNLK